MAQPMKLEGENEATENRIKNLESLWRIGNDSKRVRCNQWWFRLAYKYMYSNLDNNKRTKELKEAILQDFATYTLLGGFVLTIAFGALLEDKLKASEDPDPSSDDWGDTLRCLCWWGYILFFTLSAVTAMRAVISATAKYLLYVAIPHEIIVIALSDNLKGGISTGVRYHDLNDGNSSQEQVFSGYKERYILSTAKLRRALDFDFCVSIACRFRDGVFYPIGSWLYKTLPSFRYFFNFLLYIVTGPALFDHVDSMFYSIDCLLIGTTMAIYMFYGQILGCVCCMITAYTIYNIRKEKSIVFDVALPEFFPKLNDEQLDEKLNAIQEELIKLMQELKEPEEPRR